MLYLDEHHREIIKKSFLLFWVGSADHTLHVPTTSPFSMLELSKTLSTKILESLRAEIESERISAASHRSPRTEVPNIP